MYPSRRSARRAGSFALGFVVLLSACAGGDDRRGPDLIGEPIRRIVLVTIDTLRADHLQEFGYPLETAPFLQSLARQGISFRRAYAQSSTTGPSHASMFTGVYPIQHRVLTNGHVLADSFITLAESFAEAGFRTAAFVSADAQFTRSLIGQGFETYDSPESKNDRREAGNAPYRRADQTTRAAMRWLSTRSADESYFLWIHYYDPHRPLLPPRRDRHAVQPTDRETFGRYLVEQHGSSLDARALEEILDYDGEIHFVDRQLGRLDAFARRRGLDDGSLWVVTSDHGQGLANHDWFGHHRQIYNVHLHVPLIFRFADGRGLSRAITDALVEHVDLHPTLLGLAGIAPPDQGMPASGRSLVPLLRGDSTARGHAYSLAVRRQLLEDDRLNQDLASYEPGEKYSLQDLRYKYIWWDAGPHEFYDLAADPYELRNLADDGHPEIERFRTELTARVRALRSDGDAEQVDAATRERLRALGYIQ